MPRHFCKIFILALIATASLAAPAHAANLILNGDFETGNYTDWTVNTEPGSEGGLNVVANNGGNSPLSNHPYALNATGGNFFSITDQNGPGSYSLTQSFTLTSAATVDISFQMFVNNDAGINVNNGLDLNTIPNQNAVVDILTGSANPFTTATGDIVDTLYGPGSDSLTKLPNPWTTYNSTLSLAAGTYQIRFAEVDNQLYFQQGVDNVSITTMGGSAAPLPPSFLMFATALLALGGYAWRRRATA